MALRDIKLVYSTNQDYPIENNVLEYKILPAASTVIGKENLRQRITKRILTKKGTQNFHRELGSDFLGLLNTNSVNDVEILKTSIPLLVDDLVTQLKKEQLQDELEGKILDDEEYLENIKLESALFDATFGGWVIILTVYTKSQSFTMEFS